MVGRVSVEDRDNKKKVIKMTKGISAGKEREGA